MNRWHSAYESVLFSVKILVLGLLFSGIGNVFLNTYMVNTFHWSNSLLTVVAYVLVYIGSFIITLYPLLLLSVLLLSKTNDNTQVVTGIVNYVVLQIVVTFAYPMLSKATLSSNVFNSFFSVNLEKLGIGTGTGSAFSLGLIAALIVYVITRYSSKQTTRFGGYGLLGFLDNHMWSLLLGVLLTAAAGIALAYIWPFILQLLYAIFDVIRSDVRNPMNFFIYGFVDRIASLLNLSNIVRSEFWLASFGGSWMDSFGSVFNGDLNIWLAQMNLGILYESGKFTAAYYIINIFAIPGYLFAMYRTYSGSYERRKHLILLIVVFLISVLSGNILPIEIIMLLTAPLLYVIHLLLVSLIFAIVSGLSLFVGFSTMTTLNTANPGNLIDFIFYYNNSLLSNRIILMIYIGVIAFAVYFIITTFYYNNMALDILNIGVKDKKINGMISGLGGLDNIRNIQATPTKIIVNMLDSQKINISELHQIGVVRIVESRAGFTLHFGSGSYMLVKNIKRLLRHAR